MIKFYVKWSRMMKGVKIRLIVGFEVVFWGHELVKQGFKGVLDISKMG